mmetsp:Transcript_3695/g.5523  ORF Transcript_3695/g.5523 Transcript_3695/m.5523 type:complete len:296 (-) Transcript_3695:220-1107(-)
MMLRQRLFGTTNDNTTAANCLTINEGEDNSVEVDMMGRKEPLQLQLQENEPLPHPSDDAKDIRIVRSCSNSSMEEATTVAISNVTTHPNAISQTLLRRQNTNSNVESSILRPSIVHEQQQQHDGVLIAFGVEQWFSAPALLLLCPFAGIISILVVLDQEEYNWQSCLIHRNIRRIVYGFQGTAFSTLNFLALECAGDRLVYEGFPSEVNNSSMATRMFQREHSFLVLACGIGLILITNTMAIETSVFATVFGVYMVYAGWLHLSNDLPIVLFVSFVWNGLQLVLVAWLGGHSSQK